ncbi:TPA: ribonuclease YeeF family protein [Staphylococcus aureus]|nr:ribonuclease YeeF family protein [Staphylococcus aureus]HDP5791452.1 ribonuclease YeeF family protein [Staphylococcus aureus]HDP5794102.1 ribonuclease YeeF family protein [Staphylococcus aureus]HDP5934571.1 ribonuclease YeeF family protein [Staphylococcus aureus]HDP6029566.1 ribonuclease YeeF family protein [Staphylococcus aureus]
MIKDIEYLTADYDNEKSSIQSVIDAIEGQDFLDVDTTMDDAVSDVSSLDEDGAISLTSSVVGPQGSKLMGYYQNELYDYASQLDSKMKEIIDTPFIEDIDKAFKGITNVKLENILIKNGGGHGRDTYGASGKIAKGDAKKSDSDVYSIDEILKSDQEFVKVIDQHYKEMKKEDKKLSKSDFEKMMTQGASCDYMTVAEAEELEEQKKKELAVDILAGVGIIALTIVNPVAGAVAAGAYTAYSAANAATGKNIITGRKLSKEERIMEGLSLIPLPGMGFLKGAGKSLMKLGFKGGEKFAVKTGLQKTMQQAVSRISPKMGMMKNSVLNRSRNFAQNTHVGQMLSNMRGQATHTVQQSRNWIGQQAQNVKRIVNNGLDKEFVIPSKQHLASAGIGGINFAETTTLRNMGQNIKRAVTSQNHVTHGPKDSMVRSEGKHSISSHEINSSKYVESPNYTKVKYGEQYARLRPKKLKANIEYTTPNGHIYRTDHKGRIKEVYVDNLSLKDGDRNNYAQKTVGGEDRLPDDDGGHLIARMFGGSKDIDNLVAQSKFINRPFKENGEWYNIEKEWQEFLNSGKEVKNIKMEVKYSGNSKRPTEFLVEYYVNNKEFVQHVKNI